MAKQLTFDLPVRESRARGDYFVSAANAMAVARLEAVEGWPNGKLVLVGPEGAGKTHLAHVWAEAEGAEVLRGPDLATLVVTDVSTPVVLDGADRLTPEEEVGLFHLHNHLGAKGLALLLTARGVPKAWGLTLPDVQSRMEAADLVRIESPDDALLSAVLVKQFADRQLAVPPNVIAWLLTHMDRSFADAGRIVATLDATALAERRAVTRPWAQKVLRETS